MDKDDKKKGPAPTQRIGTGPQKVQIGSKGRSRDETSDSEESEPKATRSELENIKNKIDDLVIASQTSQEALKNSIEGSLMRITEMLTKSISDNATKEEANRQQTVEIISRLERIEERENLFEDRLNRYEDSFNSGMQREESPLIPPIDNQFRGLPVDIHQERRPVQISRQIQAALRDEISSEQIENEDEWNQLDYKARGSDFGMLRRRQREQQRTRRSPE